MRPPVDRMFFYAESAVLLRLTRVEEPGNRNYFAYSLKNSKNSVDIWSRLL